MVLTLLRQPSMGSRYRNISISFHYISHKIFFWVFFFLAKRKWKSYERRFERQHLAIVLRILRYTDMHTNMGNFTVKVFGSVSAQAPPPYPPPPPPNRVCRRVTARVVLEILTRTKTILIYYHRTRTGALLSKMLKPYVCARRSALPACDVVLQHPDNNGT